MSEYIKNLGNLEERLNKYGPFPPTRRKIVIFSTGNDHEDHGPALATSSDTLFSQAFCTEVALKTGIRYLAHAPFTSDGSGDCAKAWCPIYLPEPEYFEKTTEFIKMVLDATVPRPEGVIMLVPSHGERIMSERFDEFTRRLGVRGSRFIGDIVGEGFDRLKREEYKDSPLKELIDEGIEKNQFLHCGFFDYCIAEALGHLDREKLDALRHEMEVDVEAAIKKHPAVAHLAGFVYYGGKEYDGLRRALELDAKNPELPIYPKFQNSCPIVGRAIVNHTGEAMTELVVDLEPELFGGNPGGVSTL
jgi:hypothetical protein